MKITSRDNQRLKNARKVRDGKFDDLIFVEGRRLAEEVLRSKLTVTTGFFTENFLSNENSAELLLKLQALNIPLFETNDSVFKSLAATKTSPGIILIAEKPVTGQQLIEKALSLSKRLHPLLVMLHRINNPSNLGAVLRTAEAAGVNGFILTEGSADPFSPKALRGAMGSGFRMPIWERADFFEVLDWARNLKLKTICADISSETSYSQINWKMPRLLIFGSEAHGLSRKEREAIDESLLIPMENRVESLNLAVSSGIILFEAKRQTSANEL